MRAAWAEQFNLSPEFATPKRMAAALRELGFNYVFDTDFAADLTIMEEGSEFLERFTHKKDYRWPMFTSCCPGWVRFLKSQHILVFGKVSRADRGAFHREIPAADVRRHCQDLLCREDRH